VGRDAAAIVNIWTWRAASAAHFFDEKRTRLCRDTNPVVDPEHQVRDVIKENGFFIAEEGMEFFL
jgi:hypothetical protein